METHSRSRVMRWYTALWASKPLDGRPCRSRLGKSWCVWFSGLRPCYNIAVPSEGLFLQWKNRGVKKSALAQMWVLFSTLLVFDSFAMSQTSAVQASSQPGTAYQFSLMKGQGVAVCEAYLERLNITEYASPPYCDRPENDAITGFARLNRVPLSAEAVQELLPRIKGFTDHKNQDWQDLVNAGRQRDGLPFSQPLSDVKNYLDRDIKVWQYDPSVDIDNDDVSDNVIIWHGFGASGYTGLCGQESPYDKGRTVTLRQTQIAYVLKANNKYIDVFKTMTIFGHPSGGYRIPDESGRGTPTSSFRPVGPSISIFKYQGLYYFDTFFDSWGDFQNQRREYADIFNTLAVFLRQAGKTQQICEYLMTETHNTNERDKQ
jgi:hypothetical protein